MPKRALACLMHGSEESIEEANRLILSMREKGKMGTGHIAYINGGYDFTATSLVTVLQKFGSMSETPLLSPEAEDHLLNTLLNFKKEAEEIQHQLGDSGFKLSCPNMPLIEESENHTWMILSSVYLGLKYKTEKECGGNVQDALSSLQDEITSLMETLETTTEPKEAKGLEDAIKGKQKLREKLERKNDLIAHMEDRICKFAGYIDKRGFHEFNSRPYIAFSMHPLLNLEGFGSERVRNASRGLLDHISYIHSLRSYNDKAYSLFCRLFCKAKEASFENCHQTAMWKSWKCEEGEDASEDIVGDSDVGHMITASLLPYRPPQELVDLSSNKGAGYLAFIGHGKSAEVYAAGKKTLMSGGVKDPKDPDATVRPITLISSEGTRDYNNTLSLGRPGKCQEVNNTGVYKNFACSKGPLNIGELEPIYIRSSGEGEWMLFEIQEGVYALGFAHNESGAGTMGVIAAFEEDGIDAERAIELFDEAVDLNTAEGANIRESFQFPSGGPKINYDVDSKRSKWVIKSVEEGDTTQEFDRNIEGWPQVRDTRF